MGLFSLFKKPAAAPKSAIPTDGGGSGRSDLSALVVPMISGQAWMDANKEIFSRIPDFPAGEWPAAIPYADGLFVTYAIDPGPSWEMVGISAAEGFGDPDHLRAIAMENLRRRGDISIEGGNGRFRLTTPDERDLSASAVLDADRWRKAIPIPGDLAIAIPTRIEVLICAADDEAAVAVLAGMAKTCFEDAEGKPVSPRLYRLSGTTLSPLEV